MTIKSNHDLQECVDCQWNWERSKGCGVFLDKKDVIVDNNGQCNARIADKVKYEKLQKELKKKDNEHVKPANMGA